MVRRIQRCGYEYGGERECHFDWSAAPEATGHERSEIFFDPSASAEESYKMFFRCGVPTDGEARRQIVEHFARERPNDIHPLGGDFRYLSGMWGATSPDGVYWTALPRPLVIHYSDTTNVVYYDERLRRYVWYARCSAYGRRCIGRAETPRTSVAGPCPICWCGPVSTTIQPTIGTPIPKRSILAQSINI